MKIKFLNRDVLVDFEMSLNNIHLLNNYTSNYDECIFEKASFNYIIAVIAVIFYNGKLLN